LPNTDQAGDPHRLIELARLAEVSGWDGVFVWDSLCMGDTPTHDVWIELAAIAMCTERVRIGPYVTPLSRRRPWKVARETTTLDHLSRGRLTLPVGLGASDDGGFTKVGEETDRKIKAQRLDESLAILTGLWSGKSFRHSGKHYQIDEMTFAPRPMQSPGIPIWVVAAWPRNRSLQRAIQHDGMLPAKMMEDGSFAEVLPDDVREIKQWVTEHRTQPGLFDIVMEGDSPSDAGQALDKIRPYAEAGITWWLENVWRAPDELEGMRRRIQVGPPRIQ
jgi:alkanesulfonate monooxygenase SsuD/methylene tetrahydromethanopterin reductase-like flavin-dependent oxidoreductase (luciferase family)